MCASYTFNKKFKVDRHCYPRFSCMMVFIRRCLICWKSPTGICLTDDWTLSLSTSKSNGFKAKKDTKTSASWSSQSWHARGISEEQHSSATSKETWLVADYHFANGRCWVCEHACVELCSKRRKCSFNSPKTCCARGFHPLLAFRCTVGGLDLDRVWVIGPEAAWGQLDPLPALYTHTQQAQNMARLGRSCCPVHRGP